LQPQYEALGSRTLSGYTSNLYIRRTRLLVGGTLFGVFEYFIDTDFPNLFKNNATVTPAGGMAMSAKSTPGLNIQDAFATWKAYGDYAKLDVGYMLPPMSHNAVQGATTLYSWDYFTYTFRHSDAFGSAPPSPVGRDTGAQARGLVAGGHVEYRLGVFQGLRNQTNGTDVAGRNAPRLTGRVQVNLLDPETGFFYAGSYLGAKKVLSVGGWFDIQNDYHGYGGDVFVDMPIGPGVLTAQVDVSHWDGQTFIALPKQTALGSEVGYLIAGLHLSPIVRVDHLWLTGDDNDLSRYAGGVAFWPFGHNSNVKAFYSRESSQAAAEHAANAFNLQWQIYYY